MHILTADDDSVSRTLLVRTLEHWGHEVEVVDEGLEARRRLVEPGGPTLAILSAVAVLLGVEWSLLYLDTQGAFFPLLVAVWIFVSGAGSRYSARTRA